MDEGENARRQKAARGQWQDQAEEPVQGRGAKTGRGLDLVPADPVKGRLERLHHEGQGIEDGSDHEPREGEGQRVAGHRHPEPPDRGGRVEQDEKIETDHGWRQDQGQGRDGLDDRPDPAARIGQPPGKRCAQHKQDQGCDGRQVQGEENGRNGSAHSAAP